MSLLRRIEKGGSGGSGGDGGGKQPPNGPTGGAGEEDPNEESKLASMRMRRQVVGSGAPASRSENSYHDLKSRVQNRLLTELDQSMDLTRKAEVRTHIEELFNAILSEESMVLSRAERQRLFESIIAEILGFGPLEPLLADEGITEIMVNGAKNIFIERKGNLTRANV